MKQFLLLLLISMTLSVLGQNSIIKTYKSFNAFYNQLANQTELKFKMLPIKDTLTSVTKYGKDSTLRVFSFTVGASRIKYVTTNYLKNKKTLGSAFILYNDIKITPNNDFRIEELEIDNAKTISINGTEILIITSTIPDCNGSFCRVQFDQIFQINSNEIHYQKIEGWSWPENIYCDINKDNLVDIITFMGSCTHYTDQKLKNEKYDFCITAKTIKRDQLINLTDNMNKPYFVYIQVDDPYDLKNMKVLDYNWINR